MKDGRPFPSAWLSTMDRDDIRCPTCGGRVRVMFDTAIQRGMRTPIDPFLCCALGHRTWMSERSRSTPDVPGETAGAETGPVG